jgi:hypothetical protein
MQAIANAAWPEAGPRTPKAVPKLLDFFFNLSNPPGKWRFAGWRHERMQQAD